MRFLLLAAILIMALACGGTTTTIQGDSGVGDGTGNGDAPGDASGGDASNGDASCPPVPIHCRCPAGCSCSDPACTGGQWVCPAPVCAVDAGVACGPNMVCAAATQLCTVSGGGPPPPPDAGPFVSYACVSIPAACQAAPSCTCLMANDPCTGCAFGGCMGDASTGFTVSCACP